jgi:predicted O-methyltransferase YrrM
MEDVNSHERITLFNFDCENLNHIQEHFGDLKFDIILDDANHKLTQQMKNFENYFPYLNDGGVYICEDVQTAETAKELREFILELYPDREVHIVECDLNKKSDDRLVVVV